MSAHPLVTQGLSILPLSSHLQSFFQENTRRQETSQVFFFFLFFPVLNQKTRARARSHTPGCGTCRLSPVPKPWPPASLHPPPLQEGLAFSRPFGLNLLQADSYVLSG